MKSLCNLIAALMVELCSTYPLHALPLVWRADWPDAKPVETLVHRGTDIELQPLWRINKQPADTNGWTFTTYCQTNAVGPWFGPLPGAFFSHTNDVGAAFYNVMVRAETPDGAVNYTAFARLRMLDSPGFAPGDLPLPAQSIDFADVTVFNAPWATPADVTAATATLASASNVYTKAETDALVASATPEDYDAVRAQVNTNAADIAALETGKADKAELAGYLPLASPYADFTFGDTIHIKADMTIDNGSLALGADSNVDVTEQQGFVFSHLGSVSTLLPDGSPVLTRNAAPVQSVNSQTGVVALAAADVGALPITGGTLTGEVAIVSGFIKLVDSTGFATVLRCSGTGGDTYIEFYTDEGELTGLAFVPAISNNRIVDVAYKSRYGIPSEGDLLTVGSFGDITTSGKRAADFLSAAPLAGRTYDFATTQGVMDALAAVIATLGGSVTNKPSAATSGN